MCRIHTAPLPIILASVGVFQIVCLWLATRVSTRAAPFSFSFWSDHNTEPLSISLCIPAIPRDVESGCLDKLMQSIKRQTFKVSEVVISFSNSTYAEARRVKMLAQATVSTIPVKILRFSEVSVQGKSRNNAALVSASELVSFMDADDEMHPHRMEAIQEAFRTHRDLQVLLHGYVESEDLNWKYTPMFKPSSAYAMVGKHEICSSEARSRHQPHLDLLVHHAHITVKLTVFDEFSYDEALESYRVEDSLFVREVVAAACSRPAVNDLLFLKAPLSLYRNKSASCLESKEHIFGKFKLA